MEPAPCHGYASGIDENGEFNEHHPILGDTNCPGEDKDRVKSNSESAGPIDVKYPNFNGTTVSHDKEIGDSVVGRLHSKSSEYR